MKRLPRILAIVLGALILAGVAAHRVMVYGKGLWCATQMDLKVEVTPERVARGKYLFHHVSQCTFCHSQRDFTRYGGPPIEGTIAVGSRHPNPEGGKWLWVPNLTSHPEDGLGKWTDGEIVRAIREGVNRDGRMIAFMFVEPTLSVLADEDVYAIVAYLRSLPPVKSNKPQMESIPWRDYWDNYVMFWPNPVATVNATDHKDTRLWGQHLSLMAGCEPCHAPDYAGGRSLFDPSTNDLVVHPANLTPHPTTGIGEITEEQFLGKFRAHALPDGALAVPPPSPGTPLLTPNTSMMWPSMAGMSDEDLKAIYTFLRSLEPVDHLVVKREPVPKDAPR
jgi:cytochrome c553